MALIGLVAALAFGSACTTVPAPADDSDSTKTHTENQPADSTPAAQETIVDALPPGFFLSGEFVELGPHDPNDPNNEWIRPCTEIPDDILAGTGLDLEFTADYDFAEITSCVANVVDKDLGDTAIMITGGPMLTADYQAHELVAASPPNLRVQEILIHRMPDVSSNACLASIDTQRGLFAVSAMNLDPKITIDQQCHVATTQFESIYFMLRGES